MRPASRHVFVVWLVGLDALVLDACKRSTLSRMAMMKCGPNTCGATKHTRTRTHRTHNKTKNQHPEHGPADRRSPSCEAGRRHCRAHFDKAYELLSRAHFVAGLNCGFNKTSVNCDFRIRHRTCRFLHIGSCLSIL